MYDIQTSSWHLISNDTASMGGPQLIFDHQMAIDEDQQVIYCFGGKIVASSTAVGDNVTTERQYCGLYSYDIPTNSWHLLREDSNSPGPGQIRSRIGHSMLFYSPTRSLYMFAGQRAKDQLGDMFVYHIETGAIEVLSEANIPAAGFTQRATIDIDRGEIFVLSGMNRDKDKKEPETNMRNSLWVYSIHQNKWNCIYQNSNKIVSHCDMPLNKYEYIVLLQRNLEPCPRYAHQLVFDSIRKVHYLFGGNPGKPSLPNVRLDDFWALQLCRSSPDELMHRLRLIIREYAYRELVMKDPIAALNFLQTNVSEAVNHNDSLEEQQFQNLVTNLFSDEAEKLDEDSKSHYIHLKRMELFEHLISYFPNSMTPPKANLLDFIQV